MQTSTKIGILRSKNRIKGDFVNENKNPINEELQIEEMYNADKFSDELYTWRENIKKIVRTTGATNFDLLQENEFFRSFFPFATSSDKMVINKLLSEIKRLRK